MEEPEAGQDDENYYMEILNYYKKIKDMILTGDLLSDEQGCEVLVDRIIEDMRKKDVGIFLMSDQRCSKIFELILGINILNTKRLLDSVNFNALEENGRMFEENETFKRLRSSVSSYVFILGSILRQVEQSIFDLYGSHVTETALESSAILLGFLKGKRVLEEEKALILEEVLEFARKIGAGSLGWISVLTNSTASHVGRTVINIALGKVTMSMDTMETYIMENLGRRNQANKQKFGGRNPHSKYKVYECGGIDELKELLFTPESGDSSLSSQLLRSLREDFEGVVADTYALPSLILFVRALFELRMQRKGKLVSLFNHFLTAIMTNGQEEEDLVSGFESGDVDSEKVSRLLSNLTQSWVHSNLKSRLLELLLDVIPYEFLVIWINSHTLSKEGRDQLFLNDMIDSEYGHFVVLNLLKSGRIRREEFIPILKSLDFSKLVSKRELADILVSLMENCRRLQSEYKCLAKKLWKSIGIDSSEDYQYTFSCIISQKKKSELVEEKEERADSEGKLKITSHGCLMISSLSKFPTDTIHPLTSGITYFINKHKSVMLGDILETPFGIRLTETILSSSSNIPQSLKKRWIQSYFGNFLNLALAGTCNYAIIAMFHASDNLFRKMIVQELLNEELGGGKDILMSKNFKIFKSLKIENFNKKDDWNLVNEKIDKTRKLFSDIIDNKIDILQETTTTHEKTNTHNPHLTKKNTNKRKQHLPDDVTDDTSMGNIIKFIKKNKK